MNFTNEELYIIERTMDNLCSDHLRGIMQYTHTMNNLPGDLKKKGQKFIEKEFSQWVKTHDALKTICAKCEMIRANIIKKGTAKQAEDESE